MTRTLSGRLRISGQWFLLAGGRHVRPEGNIINEG